MRTRSSSAGLLLCALLSSGCDLILPYAVQPAGGRDSTSGRDARPPADANGDARPPADANGDARPPADASNAPDQALPDGPAGVADLGLDAPQSSLDATPVLDAAAVDATASADGGWAVCLETPGQYVCVGDQAGMYGCGAGCGEYDIDCTDQGKCSCSRGGQAQPCAGTPPGTSCDQCLNVVLDPLCCAGL